MKFACERQTPASEYMAPWSSGQDASLSRWNQGFDSPRSHCFKTLRRMICGDFFALKPVFSRVLGT